MSSSHVYYIKLAIRLQTKLYIFAIEKTSIHVEVQSPACLITLQHYLMKL